MNSANSVEKITFLYYFTNSIVNPEKEKHKEEEIKRKERRSKRKKSNRHYIAS